MDGPSIPGSTLRVLASLLVLAFDVAREKAADVYARIKPLVEPPDDLRVTSRVGALYSGIIVLDRSEIIAGVVVQTGQSIPTPSLSSFSSATFPDSREKLRGWAEDPREDEDPPWRR